MHFFLDYKDSSAACHPLAAMSAVAQLLGAGSQLECSVQMPHPCAGKFIQRSSTHAAPRSQQQQRVKQLGASMNDFVNRGSAATEKRQHASSIKTHKFQLVCLEFRYPILTPVKKTNFHRMNRRTNVRSLKVALNTASQMSVTLCPSKLYFLQVRERHALWSLSNTGNAPHFQCSGNALSGQFARTLASVLPPTGKEASCKQASIMDPKPVSRANELVYALAQQVGRNAKDMRKDLVCCDNTLSSETNEEDVTKSITCPPGHNSQGPISPDVPKRCHPKEGFGPCKHASSQLLVKQEQQ
eukprot:121826-Pelagomonas_calceolata.AAC.1